MLIHFNSEAIVFLSDFDADHHILQVFRGIDNRRSLIQNAPVDYRMAGLKRKTSLDFWHPETVLSWATDEVPPITIRKGNMDTSVEVGGNHCFECCVRVIAPGHGLGLREVGTVWKDETGKGWTLLRVETADRLLFFSSPEEFVFNKEINGSLCLGNKTLIPASQRYGASFVRSTRRISMDVTVPSENGWTPVCDYAENVPEARITEVYEIVDPTTSAAALVAKRPKDGYTEEPDIALGRAVVRITNIYNIKDDGTVVSEHHSVPAEDYRVCWAMGLMYQEKCDLGGGNWRWIPGLKPFDGFDFTNKPVNTSSGPWIEKDVFVPNDAWLDPNDPPIRQIDFMKDVNGTVRAAFVAGFLPIWDAEPAFRAAHVGEALTLAPSRKTYPTLVGSFCCRNNDPMPLGREVRFVGYRKYLAPSADGRYTYTIPFDGTDYTYTDDFSGML